MMHRIFVAMVIVFSSLSFINGTVFNIKTSAAFIGNTTVGIHFDGSGLTDAQKFALKIFRIDSAKGSVWGRRSVLHQLKHNISGGAPRHFPIFGAR